MYYIENDKGEYLVKIIGFTGIFSPDPKRAFLYTSLTRAHHVLARIGVCGKVLPAKALRQRGCDM